jgi:glucose/arabinose dehydrogenase
MKFRLLLTLIGLLLVAALAACNGGGGGGGGDGDGDGGGAKIEFGYDTEVVYEGDAPSVIAFAPDGRIFFAERNSGSVRIISEDGTLQEEPWVNVAPAQGFEWGLLGMALDPDFEDNGYVYLYYTEAAGAEPPTVQPLLVRYTDANNRGTDRSVIIDDLPETDPMHPYYHAGSNIAFGPDGFLYMAMGDYDARENAQDLSAPQGKILRVDPETGEAADGNPFEDDPEADPRIFAYGFRKPYDIAFHPESEELYAVENNPATCDELNIIQAGKNYGWPLTDEFRFDDCTKGQVTEPIHFFHQEGMDPLENLSTVFPTGLAWLTSDRYPELPEGSLLVCESTPMILRSLTIEGPGFDTVTDDPAIAADCVFDVAVSPDGVIYYSNFTQLRRIIPPEPAAEGE